MTIYPVVTKTGQIFERVLEKHPQCIWGACKLDFSEYQGQYEYAAVVIVPHVTQIQKENYTEAAMFDAMHDTGPGMFALEKELMDALTEAGVDWGKPNIIEEEVDKGHSPLSAKYTAVRAGLGWIGKNDLLITPQYGPRLHMLQFLINGPLDTGTPISESRCGDCTICVDHCLFKAIQGTLWRDDGKVTRDDIVDFQKCLNGREKARKKLGRRMTCARCIAYCPYGTDAPKPTAL